MFKNDRRIFDRFQADFDGEIKVPEIKKEEKQVRFCDVSATGAGMLSRKDFVPETKLEIWLSIPDGHGPFRAQGKVVWAKQVQEDKWRLGLEFNSVDFMGLRRIFEKVAPPR